MTAPQTDDARVAMERDAQHLRRSLAVNLVGYALKFAQPFLLIVAIGLYGPGPYGVFTLAQAILTVLMRLSLFGLDKALLWWIPRQPPTEERTGLRAVLTWALVGSGLGALATGTLLADVLAAWAGRPEVEGSLRWMAAGLIPMAATEVLAQACAGKRDLRAHVLFKNGLVTVAMPAAAIGLWFLGLATTGLALSFFVATSLGLVGTVWSFFRVFRGSSWRGQRWALPRPLWRYAWPTWLAEMALALFQRLDVFVLAALTDDVAVGIFAGAATYAANATAVRVSFDPMVVALVSTVHHAEDAPRLRRGFADVWLLIAALQVPLTAALLLAAPWVMPLLGPQYAAGVAPAQVLIALYSVHGMFGLNQHIITGSGRSGLALLDMLAALAVGTLLLGLLIPGHGVVGAAWGIGLTYVALNGLWAVQARVLTGGWHYERRVGMALVLAGLAAAAAGLSWLALGPARVGDVAARVVALAAFHAVFVPGVLALRRRPAVTPSASAGPTGSGTGGRR